MKARSLKQREHRGFSPAQCRGARGLLDWSREELAEKANLPPAAIELFECGEVSLTYRQARRLGGAFNSAGVIAKTFGGGGQGVRFITTGGDEASAVRSQRVE